MGHRMDCHADRVQRVGEGGHSYGGNRTRAERASAVTLHAFRLLQRTRRRSHAPDRPESQPGRASRRHLGAWRRRICTAQGTIGYFSCGSEAGRAPRLIGGAGCARGGVAERFRLSGVERRRALVEPEPSHADRCRAIPLPRLSIGRGWCRDRWSARVADGVDFGRAVRARGRGSVLLGELPASARRDTVTAAGRVLSARGTRPPRTAGRRAEDARVLPVLRGGSRHGRPSRLVPHAGRAACDTCVVCAIGGDPEPGQGR